MKCGCVNSKCVVAVEALVATATKVGEHAGEMNGLDVISNQVAPGRGKYVAELTIERFHAVS